MANDEECSEDERFRRQVEPLDYSPSSGAVGSEQKEYEAISEAAYPDSANHTTWADRDTDNETKRVFGKKMNKWSWLKRLNKGQTNGDRRGDNRRRGRYNDFLILVDQIENINEQEKEWLHRRAFNFCQTVADDREDGLQFGGTRTTEVTELAILSQAARSLLTIESFDEKDMDNGLHNIAFDGGQLESLVDTWPPKQVDVSIATVRDLRSEIRPFVTGEQK